MKSLHEKDVYNFLAIYRFFTYALAVVLVEVLHLGVYKTPDLQTHVTLAAVGVYTLIKISPLSCWGRKAPASYIVLVSDLAICLPFLFFTGGLASPLLLYSLAPLISAALLFNERFTLSVDAAFSALLVAIQIGLSQTTNQAEWAIDSRHLPWLTVWGGLCLLIVTVPYRANLNIRRNIERDAILGERRRLRREIHDGMAQTLTYLNMKTKIVTDSVSSLQVDKALTGLAEIRTTVQDAYRDVRESLDQLSAEVMDSSLVATLATYAGEFGEENGIQARFVASDDSLDLSPAAELQLMRIAQEALTNVRKHAQATEVLVRLDNARHGVQMSIKDNGRGIDPAEHQNDSRKRHGLIVMRERAESLGGSLDISTMPGEGLEIKVRIPSEKVRPLIGTHKSAYGR